jgi:hypothetical protein
MSAIYPPLWRDVWFRAKREKRTIVETVMMADDSIRLVKFGPRGGWSFV